MTDTNSKSWAEASNELSLCHLLKPWLPGVSRRNSQLPLASAQDSGHYIPPRAHALRTTSKKGVQMLGNKNKRQMSTTVWPGRIQEEWLSDLSKQVDGVLLMEIGNQEAGLGSRGRTEVSVRHDELVTWGRFYLMHVLQFHVTVSFNGFPWLLGGEKYPQVIHKTQTNLASDYCTRFVSHHSVLLNVLQLCQALSFSNESCHFWP